MVCGRIEEKGRRRLIDADNIENYAHEPEFGIKDEMENWIAEINIPADIKNEYEEELKELCWKVLKSCMNVIKTEPTAVCNDYEERSREMEE